MEYVHIQEIVLKIQPFELLIYRTTKQIFIKFRDKFFF